MQGCDGIIINGEKSSLYVVFDPNQVKSATDNIGTFDSSNPDIRYSADDAETIAKPETQRITEISSRAKAMGINNLHLHLDKKRSQILRPGRKGANYPTTISEADFKDNIHRFWKNVNWKDSGGKIFLPKARPRTFPSGRSSLRSTPKTASPTTTAAFRRI